MVVVVAVEDRVLTVAAWLVEVLTVVAAEEGGPGIGAGDGVFFFFFLPLVLGALIAVVAAEE